MGQNDTRLYCIDTVLQNNNLDHMTQVMSYHPKYLDSFLQTQHYILRGDGPLPYDYRHYIAIMAAGRHQCGCLINLQKKEFLLQGGDESWLKGLQHIPQKLRNLYEINKILAHRPWLINKEHIEKLTKGKNNWSLGEVVHAIVLLAHFHAFSSFVFSCGISEMDLENGYSTSSQKNPLPTNQTTFNSELKGNKSRSPLSLSPATDLRVDVLMQKMKTLAEKFDESSPEEKTKRFEIQKVESQFAELPDGVENVSKPQSDIEQYIEDPGFLYQDFTKGEMSDIPTFRVQDYSWDDQAFSLINRLYNDVGNILDEKFKIAYNLTYHTLGSINGVDTFHFRRALWNYIQCMFGIQWDDYDYGEVNQLLEKTLKSFIKKVCCTPEMVTKKDSNRVMREFKNSERVHVNLVILEARLQTELLYATRAVMGYMT